MTIIKPSFSDAFRMRNLADVKVAVEGSPDLDPRQKREIVSALNTLAKWLNRPLEQIPAAPESLRRHFASIHHETVGVSKARLANVRSLINKALTIAGIKATNRPVAEALSPDWQPVMAGLIDHYRRSSLAPFVRFCSDQGIAPADVSDSIAALYLRHLEETALVKKPRTTQQTVCRTWNQARDNVAGWPDIALRVPVYRETYTLAWAEFPQSLRDEVDAHLNHLALSKTVDFLDETAPARALRPNTLKAKRRQILQFASALVHRGVPIESLTSLKVLSDPQHFKTGLAYLLDRPRNDKDHPKSTSYVAHTIRSIAKHWAGLSEEKLEPMNVITKNLGRRRPGMTPKNRERLNQFEDEATSAKLMDFSFIGLDRLLDGRELTYREAVKAQIYIAIMILEYAPMRISNLASLRFDEHVKLPLQNKPGETIVSIPSDQVKNGEPHIFALPNEITAQIIRYRKIVKPLLEKDVTQSLFPNGRGAPKRSDTLGKKISKLIWDELGIKFNPHLMRHLAAKLNLDAHPGNYEGTRRLLGHKSHETTYNAYEGLETMSASRVQNDIIRSLRRYVSLAELQDAKTARTGPKAVNEPALLAMRFKQRKARV